MIAPMKRREETGEQGTREQAVWAGKMEAAIANTDLSLGFHLSPTGLWRAKE